MMGHLQSILVELPQSSITRIHRSFGNAKNFTQKIYYAFLFLITVQDFIAEGYENRVSKFPRYFELRNIIVRLNSL